MLDTDLKNQLVTVFADLGHSITFLVDASTHAQQAELMAMLEDVASTSPQLQVQASGHTSAVPRFALARDGVVTGVSFKGIPGGHEFTSLIVGVLNAAGKGKLPDAAMAQRIQRMKGPVKIQTLWSRR